MFSSQPTVCSLLLIVLQTWGGGLGRSVYKVGTLLTHLSHQIHFSSLSSRAYPHPTQTYTSLQDLLLLWTHTCPVISFLITLLLLSFRTAPEQQQSSYNSNSDSFLLLNGTLDCLLPLLKWAIYLFPSPPSHLIYIPKVRPYCFQFHMFSHTSSFHLICTSDSLSLTPMAKMELHC